ncbi:MAG: DUF309 domain-containing protein [Desulfobulbaceae bacterium]|uniref:DUF309 domain-containing protein n=1 Tax=Candidatus Desulfobia pelagia TaxID=2841692 RepID=A0A8J6NBY1_9BACT|nr:DUF309 domain-containing protein [Candidatus Desulfobia pelagia]
MQFDPFQYRLCRNIRNELSESLMEAIKQKDLAPSSAVVKKYDPKGTEHCISSYLHARIRRYSNIIKEIQSSNIPSDDTYVITLLLWNQELFFEVHEWLEPRWLKATGTEKNILQALIRAAGTYILLEYDRTAGAEKMAAKAAATLFEHKESIPPLFDIELLISRLQALDPVAPKFKTAGLI